ncbi:MAG: hypothetical protein Q4G59_04510 [Planctomycetia bacterium]|nr:hypothetical protein [Planctomycetia bacterium]
MPGTSSAIRNLNFVKVSWNGVTFNCTAKSLPSFRDAPVWLVSTDNTDEVTGVAITGKPAGLEPIELTIETDAQVVYGSLLSGFVEGTESSAVFTYTPGGTAAAVSVTVPKCKICGLVTSSANNNSAATTIVRLQPEGGESGNMPSAG